MLKVMPDYCASGIWSEAGMVDLNDLPISDGLKWRFHTWQRIFDNLDSHVTGVEVGSYTEKVLVWIGLQAIKLAVQLKKELPTFIIVVRNDNGLGSKYYNLDIVTKNYLSEITEDTETSSLIFASHLDQNTEILESIDFERINEGMIYYSDDQC